MKFCSLSWTMYRILRPLVALRSTSFFFCSCSSFNFYFFYKNFYVSERSAPKRKSPWLDEGKCGWLCYWSAGDEEGSKRVVPLALRKSESKFL